MYTYTHTRTNETAAQQQSASRVLSVNAHSVHYMLYAAYIMYTIPRGVRVNKSPPMCSLLPTSWHSCALILCATERFAPLASHYTRVAERAHRRVGMRIGKEAWPHAARGVYIKPHTHTIALSRGGGICLRAAVLHTHTHSPSCIQTHSAQRLLEMF